MNEMKNIKPGIYFTVSAFKKTPIQKVEIVSVRLVNSPHKNSFGKTVDGQEFRLESLAVSQTQAEEWLAVQVAAAKKSGIEHLIGKRD